MRSQTHHTSLNQAPAAWLLGVLAWAELGPTAERLHYKSVQLTESPAGALFADMASSNVVLNCWTWN